MMVVLPIKSLYLRFGMAMLCTPYYYFVLVLE